MKPFFQKTDCVLKTKSVEVLACEVCITGSCLFADLASYCLSVVARVLKCLSD